MENGDEQAGDTDSVANLGAATESSSIKQHPPKQQGCEEEADVLQPMHKAILEHEPVEWRGVPQPERGPQQRRRGDGVGGCPPAGGGHSGGDKKARKKGATAREG